ncbi:DNA photolyase domain of deoxyribodipyrimidine photolyase [Synechococcus sp. A15-127]|uniref:hypothetical protein n=1 Tax=Synechococcus sp. A15-127 TaxID=1050624 RepID=UPI0016453AC2|nr:hypothetical protein [Synechococcus sp. A15-127]QNI93357.1 DNA photolyase domain of deoxyribodipyrimidine photolyase [Synechococcus sp. A15-127]
MTMQRPMLWIHEEALGPANPALRAWPDAPALFVFDTHWIEANRISRKRLGFLYEAALELTVSLRKGDVASEVLAFARRHEADGVVTSSAVDPRLQQILQAIEAELPISELAPDPFVELPRPPRLGRFSRYWREAEPVVWAAY